MTTKLEAAARHALEALEYVLRPTGDFDDVVCQKLHDTAITDLREALAEQANEPDWKAEATALRVNEQNLLAKLAEQQAQQEPVAWLVESKHGNWAPYLEWSEPSYLETQVVTPLYTSPQPSKPWVGLTDEECGQVINANFGTGLWAMAKDIEAKLREKNT